MKIFVIEGNYDTYNIPAVCSLSIENSMHDELPLLQASYYMLTDAALTQRNRPFFVPDFAKPCVVQPHLVVRIDRLGKHISERFAHRYYNEISVGATFTNATLFRQLRKEGLAWESAKHFEGAASIGKWLDYPREARALPSTLTLKLNGSDRVSASSSKMLQGIDSLISAISRYHKLCQGDLLFCGTPTEGITVEENDTIAVELQNQTLLNFRVK